MILAILGEHQQMGLKKDVESVLITHVKNAENIIAIMKLNFLSIVLDLWRVLKNVMNQFVILPKLKRNMEVCKCLFSMDVLKIFLNYLCLVRALIKLSLLNPNIFQSATIF
uniref:Uncharacterized protein n=1 Tax=Meloidogyne hapla TaxID=6305 RepID=A0A1I8BU91_MELHA